MKIFITGGVREEFRGNHGGKTRAWSSDRPHFETRGRAYSERSLINDELSSRNTVDFSGIEYSLCYLIFSLGPERRSNRIEICSPNDLECLLLCLRLGGSSEIGSYGTRKPVASQPVSQLSERQTVFVQSRLAAWERILKKTRAQTPFNN